jgi:hypothetical protein
MAGKHLQVWLPQLCSSRTTIMVRLYCNTAVASQMSFYMGRSMEIEWSLCTSTSIRLRG